LPRIRRRRRAPAQCFWAGHKDWCRRDGAPRP
jgi:hypothetical protein